MFFLIVSFSCVSVVLFVRFYLIEFLSLSISCLSLCVWFVLFFSFSVFACVFLMLCLLCLIVFVVCFVLFARLVVCLLADPLFDCVSVLSSDASLMFFTIGNVIFDNTLYISLRL